MVNAKIATILPIACACPDLVAIEPLHLARQFWACASHGAAHWVFDYNYNRIGYFSLVAREQCT